MSTRDYSSIFDIKDFAMKQVAPKYMEVDGISDINVGLLGFSTEMIGLVSEDTIGSFVTHYREIFPNTAMMPETIYNYAAINHFDKLFAVPAKIDMVLFVKEEDIFNLGTKKPSYYEFFIDKNLTVDIEGKQFSPDYDIYIMARPYRGDYIFNVTYQMDFHNSISKIKNPYIKTKRVSINNVNYIGLFVTLHQVQTTTHNEILISNDKINVPAIELEFNDMLANIEVFYKPPGSDNFIQLTRLLENSVPIKRPFFFYRLKDTDKIEISFSAREGYFQPEFNSELNIILYTSIGEKGNFPFYKGDNISVIPKSDKYDYNNNIILFAVPQSESVNGVDTLGLEDLRSAIIERMSTSGAYNIENDLQLYFNNFPYKNKINVLFMKRRDDALERLFSGFSMFRTSVGDIYHTNTCHMDIKPTQFDMRYVGDADRLILRAGHLFKYKDGTNDTLVPIDNKTLKDDLSTIDEEFVYTNPLMISISKKPSIAGFYLNTINESIPLDYTEVNNDSIIQFIVSNLSIKRNAVKGEDCYKITVTLSCTTSIDSDLLDTNGNDLGILKAKLFIEEEGGSEICYSDFKIIDFNKSKGTVTIETHLKTDDYITSSERFKLVNAKDVSTGEQSESKLIPMTNCKVNVAVFYKLNKNIEHKYFYLEDLDGYTLTNVYSTDENRIDFITPFTMMRSIVKYIPDTDNGYRILFHSLPFNSAFELNDNTKLTDFIFLLRLQYNYLMDIISNLTNNFGVDLKFYNTYGKSRTFFVGEEKEILNKVNSTIKFKVSLAIGVFENDVIRDIKGSIKKYIESVNGKGFNGIYVSNLIKLLENTYPDIKYLKFESINGYDTSKQIIESAGLDMSQLSKEQRKQFVPEFLTILLDDIHIDIIGK